MAYRSWMKGFILFFSALRCHGFPLLLATRRQWSPYRGAPLSRTLGVRSAVTVGGLVDDFDRLQVTHNTIRALRKDLPLLLYKPYAEDTASESFTLETEIVVGKDDYVLASSREEMITLQNAVLLAVQGPLRATNLLSRRNITAPLVNCRFVIQNVDASELLVDWDVQGAIANTNVSGLSELKLQDGKVSIHRLRKVLVNGQSQDAEAVGNALSRIRQTVRSLQQAQGLQSTIVPFGSMLSQYRDDIIRQLDLVLPSQAPTAPISFEASKNEASQDNMDLPIPGTLPWECYARSHVAIETFVNEIIPKLALAPSDATFDLEGLFSSESELIGLDGTTLISNGPRLAKFYQSMASWRRRSLTTWTLVEANAMEWQGKLQVRISFVTVLPGSETSLSGVDRYTLDTEPGSNKIRILSVHQESMSIGENSKQQDLVLLMRGIVDFAENDRFANADEQWIAELWQRLRAQNGDDKASGTNVSGPPKRQSKIPIRSDAAAATVYRIMTALHNDGADLADPSIASNRPPALDFMIENVQFRGLLNEILARGRSSYQQNLGMSIESLKSSLRAKRITSEREPSTKVELTSAGNIRYSLTLFLKVATFTGIPSLLNVPSTGLPLRVDLISDYILDPDSGRIVQHRVIESRLNDQLTPGDVFSRILLRGQEGLPFDENAWGRALADVLGRFTNNR